MLKLKTVENIDRNPDVRDVANPVVRGVPEGVPRKRRERPKIRRLHEVQWTPRDEAIALLDHVRVALGEPAWVPSSDLETEHDRRARKAGGKPTSWIVIARELGRLTRKSRLFVGGISRTCYWIKQ